MDKNRIIIRGCIGKDAEVRTVGNTTVAKLSVCTNYSFTNKAGQTTDEKTWHTVQAWSGYGKPKDLTTLTKGKTVEVEGRYRSVEWTDRDGNKRYGMEIVADELVIIEKEASNSQPTQTAHSDSDF